MIRKALAIWHGTNLLRLLQPSRPPQNGGTALLMENARMRPKKIILCVDDNEQTLAVRKFMLETRGYRVLSATGAQEALEIMERYAPGELSLLLCDLLMPQMDGVELIRRAREMQPGLPSLMVSGTVATMERGSGADVFLPKGACSPVELLERVRVLVARKRGPKKAAVAARMVEPTSASSAMAS